MKSNKRNIQKESAAILFAVIMTASILVTMPPYDTDREGVAR